MKGGSGGQPFPGLSEVEGRADAGAAASTSCDPKLGHLPGTRDLLLPAGLCGVRAASGHAVGGPVEGRGLTKARVGAGVLYLRDDVSGMAVETSRMPTKRPQA
jgi:hypothetical protein